VSEGGVGAHQTALAAASVEGTLSQGQQLARAASLMLAEASIHALIDLRRHSQVFSYFFLFVSVNISL
jgi:hypothetical protein